MQQDRRDRTVHGPREKRGKKPIRTGYYICCDSEKCNQNLMTLDHLNHFVAQLTKE